MHRCWAELELPHQTATSGSETARASSNTLVTAGKQNTNTTRSQIVNCGHRSQHKPEHKVRRTFTRLCRLVRGGVQDWRAISQTWYLSRVCACMVPRPAVANVWVCRIYVQVLWERWSSL